MSDRLEPDWEINPASNETTSSQADVTVLSGPGLPDSWNSSDLSLVEYFPDIFIQTSLPETTSTILNVRGPEPAHALEYGESSGSKRKVDDETPQLATTSQSEDIEGSPRESERKQLDDRPKRTRTAEIHNTTERRRRSRINEKIMALGELIPNCKKTDKASILDDAIVYINALKLEAEMMSRARGPLYMPPPAFQSLQQVPCFPPYFTMGPWLQEMGGVGFGMNYPMFGLPPATIHPSLLPPAAGGLLPISETAPLPVSQAQIPSIPLQQLPETAAGSIFTPASIAERASAFNQPLQIGESSSQFVQRISPSSQSFPIISQGPTTPFRTSYTVHATHIIPPPSTTDYLAAENPQFDEEAGKDKSG